MEITLTIDRKAVYSEVEKTTNYTGKKMEDADGKAYERVSTTDEDEDLLQRFWDETRAEVAQTLMSVLQGETMLNEQYNLTLKVSVAFNQALLPSMKLNLFSYFVQNILAKWFVLANKAEAGEYADKAATLIEDVRQKAFFKKRPTRPVYNSKP